MFSIIKEFPDLRFKAIECTNVYLELLNRNNEIIDLSKAENFPKFFKYRSLNVLKDNMYLKSIEEWKKIYGKVWKFFKLRNKNW